MTEWHAELHAIVRRHAGMAQTLLRAESPQDAAGQLDEFVTQMQELADQCAGMAMLARAIVAELRGEQVDQAQWEEWRSRLQNRKSTS
ncbi:MAG TPA: hypothetical protein VFW65_18160 [Pseudonocardiaceae bacterium]|nr:hypothetical protein [Pseudonocardiaceae bacterium]